MQDIGPSLRRAIDILCFPASSHADDSVRFCEKTLAIFFLFPHPLACAGLKEASRRRHASCQCPSRMPISTIPPFYRIARRQGANLLRFGGASGFCRPVWRNQSLPGRGRLPAPPLLLPRCTSRNALNLAPARGLAFGDERESGSVRYYSPSLAPSADYFPEFECQCRRRLKPNAPWSRRIGHAGFHFFS